MQVINPGFLTTVQDLGRRGYERFGIPVSGGMDSFALRAANRLVGNPDDAATLEFAMLGPVFRAEEDCLAALTGVGFDLSVHSPSSSTGWICPGWTAVFVAKGSVISVYASGDTGWGYLAVSGGIDVPTVMGSRSTYLRGRFGGLAGRCLEAGDALPLFPMIAGLRDLAGQQMPVELRPAYNSNPTVEVILGPQTEWFTPVGLETFLTSEYRVTIISDRMGYRLEGPSIEHIESADVLSDGIAAGSIQVPAGGQPIVAMSDRQTTGGYAKIATVVSADLPLLAQCPLGKGCIHFRATTVEAAQMRWRNLLLGLDGIEEE